MGFLRYYIFHIDNGYKAGKSKLQRKDRNKGFSPDNCIIVSNMISTNYNSKQKPTKAKRSTKEKVLPTNVTTNNFIMIDSTVTDIKAFLSNLFYWSLETNQK